jgi:hypothetical protein
MYAKVNEKFRHVRVDSSKKIVKSAINFSRVDEMRMASDYRRQFERRAASIRRHPRSINLRRPKSPISALPVAKRRFSLKNDES